MTFIPWISLRYLSLTVEFSKQKHLATSKHVQICVNTHICEDKYIWSGWCYFCWLCFFIPKKDSWLQNMLVCISAWVMSNPKVSVMGLSAAAQYNGENGTVRQIRSLKTNVGKRVGELGMCLCHRVFSWVNKNRWMEADVPSWYINMFLRWCKQILEDHKMYMNDMIHRSTVYVYTMHSQSFDSVPNPSIFDLLIFVPLLADLGMTIQPCHCFRAKKVAGPVFVSKTTQIQMLDVISCLDDGASFLVAEVGTFQVAVWKFYSRMI